MARTGQVLELLDVRLDAAQPVPLGRQLNQQLRSMIIDGRLKPGTRLPSSRQIADRLGCSRGTVVSALDQLTAEGLLVGKERAGSFVAEILVDRRAGVPHGIQLSNPMLAAAAPLSALGQALLAAPRQVIRPGTAFSTGTPDVALFPFDVWSRLLRRVWQRPPLDAIYNQDPAGYLPLRRAIAGYLRDARGVNCAPEQVIMTSGTQQALDLAARLLLNRGDEVWVEEPGFPEARHALQAVEARLVPVPVDDDGLIVGEGQTRSPRARMAVVTPSHQYPLGMIMSYSRRIELLDWAHEASAWIIEDDYDSEFRHFGTPLPALQALDHNQRVLYTGTFAKTIFSALRLGYLVLPPSLVESFCRARYSLDPFTSTPLQPVLARFIEDGHFASHMQRMRRQFRSRREALIDNGKQHLSGALEFVGDKAGLHVVGQMNSDQRGATDRGIALAAYERGLITLPLSDFYIGPPHCQGLLLGFASVTECQIADGIRRLAEVFGSK